MGPAIVGTILTTGLATLMAVPLGILGAIYLHEYGKTGRLASVLRFFADVMTGVPSIIMGLFIFTIWVTRFGVDGVNAFAGALALGCLMLPIVIRSTEEMLQLVPNDLREASLALGSSQARTIVTVVLPAALPGIVSRRPAGRRPGRRRDGAAAVHHRGRHEHQLEPVQGPEHGAVGADLQQRPAAVRRRPGTGVGRGAHADRDDVHPVGPVSARGGAVRPVEAADDLARFLRGACHDLAHRHRHRPVYPRRQPIRRPCPSRPWSPPNDRRSTPTPRWSSTSRISPSTTARSGPCAR